LRTSDEYTDGNTRIGAYLEGPRNAAHPRTKTRDLGPWYCHEKAAKVAFPWQGSGATRQFLTRGLVSSSKSPVCLYIIALQRSETQQIWN